MKIKELNIKNFGKLKEQQITFADAMNLVYGENESGKTTIHMFIKAMLFGMERGRGRAAHRDDFSQYEPWENKNYYEGAMRFECGGRNFYLERSFDRYHKGAVLVCEDDGEELSVEDGDLEMILEGMTKETYENTISIGQMKVETSQELAVELNRFAANYYETGNSDIDLDRTFAIIKEENKKIDRFYKEAFEIKQEKRSRIEQEASYVWRDIHKLEEDLEILEEDIEEQQIKDEKAAERKKEEEILVLSESVSRWRVHPVEVLGIVFAVILSFLIFNRPWRYLWAIVIALAGGIYIWNRLKDGFKKKPEEPVEEPEAEKNLSLEKLTWERQHTQEMLKEKQVLYGNLQEQLEELDEVDDEYKKQAVRRQALELAKERLIHISEGIRKDLEQALNQKASQILEQVTGGKYTQLLIEEQLEMYLLSDAGRIPIYQVSRGTIEQIYFALRMAAAEILYEEDYPVVLDDTFVFYDEYRVERTMKWLVQNKRQVILFTCQKREQEAMERLGLSYQKI